MDLLVRWSHLRLVSSKLEKKKSAFKAHFIEVGFFTLYLVKIPVVLDELGLFTLQNLLLKFFILYVGD